MTKILLAGDHFVLNRHLRDAIEAAAPGAALAFSELVLPWPLVPFGPVAEVDEASDCETELAAAIGDAEICVTQMAPFTERVFAAAPQLKLVCVTRGGSINVNLRAAEARGIRVQSAPGRNATATAEHTLSLMLSALRRLPQRHAGILDGEWRSDLYQYRDVAFEIEGSTIGLVGYGAVGSRVARIARGFGATVLVYDPFTRIDDSEQVRQVHTLPDLLAASRIVSLHARLTEESRGMIGAAEIASMPAGSILVNAARGGLLDYDAVCDALESGHLFGAAFDVFPSEPLPAESRLRSVPNLTMTPHLAGATKETAKRAAAIAATQVKQYLQTGRERPRFPAR